LIKKKKNCSLWNTTFNKMNLFSVQKVYVFAAAKLCDCVTVIDSYDDLKPPTSPTPIQPSSKKESAGPLEAVSKPATQDTPPMPAPGVAETKPGPVETKTTRPLSPYVA
jgi:hypothetical protein